MQFRNSYRPNRIYLQLGNTLLDEGINYAYLNITKNRLVTGHSEIHTRRECSRHNTIHSSKE